MNTKDVDVKLPYTAPPAENMCCPGRDRAETVLRNRARQLHDKASELEKLADAARYAEPLVEQALWNYAMRIDIRD